ncbi:coiled-coil domain-containing protein 171-like [Antedon mediterranea]|uniref:coiled-coil domain-containing protein 171-like n=1 Tax=Antedon mediterranea TaxID=105859 RepID=UPI003AF71EA8
MMDSKNEENCSISEDILSPEDSMSTSKIKRTFEFGASIDFGNSPTEVSQELVRSRSPVRDDVKMREDIRQLRIQNRELRAELNEEEELSTKLRKTVTQLEEKNLEHTSNFNNKNSQFQIELAKLRAKIEEGESAKQTMEFELAKARNETCQQSKSIQDKQQQLKNVIKTSDEKIHDFQNYIKDLENKLKKSTSNFESAEEKYKDIIMEKEKVIATLTAQLDVMKTEKDQLDQVFQEQEGIYEDAQEKIEQLEMERNIQTETVRCQLKDIKYMTEREQTLKQEIQEAYSKVKLLEESIETERAAHLESKFNSEIVQLRVRDLEGAFDVEKSAHIKDSTKMEMVSKELSEIKLLYDKELEKGNETKNKLNSVEKEHKMVKKELVADLEEKKLVIGELSTQIDLHQKNFDELKQELKKAKKRQIYLEETYGGCMRELELFVKSYQFHESKTEKPTGKRKNKPKTDERATLSSIIVNVKSTLMTYKDRLNSKTSELSNIKNLYEKLVKECKQCKEITMSRSSTVQELQEKLRKTSKETEQLKNKCRESDVQLASVKGDLKKTSKMCQDERSQFTLLAQELHDRNKESIESEESKRLYLHCLYQRMVAGIHPNEPILSSFSWNDLSIAIHDQVLLLINLLKTEKEKVNDLESSLRMKDLKIQTLHEEHGQSLQQATMSGEERSKRMKKENEDVEKRYTNIFEQLQIKSRKTQGLADQAWEKVRLLSTINEGLESECKQLHKAVDKSNVVKTSLLASCCLLIGAYIPLCRRTKQLIIQRNILENRLIDTYVIKEKVLELVRTLSLEENQEMSCHGDMSMLMKFRTCAIAVIAANRLNRLRKPSRYLFMAKCNLMPSGVSSPVCLPSKQDTFKTLDDLYMNTAVSTITWLTNQQTLSSILQATSDLNELLILTPELQTLQSKKITQVAKVAFTQLVSNLSLAYDEPVSSSEHHQFPKERQSIVVLLGLGLKRALNMASFFKKSSTSTTQAIVSTLQKYVLEFTKRLHAAEVERRSLRIEVSKLTKDLSDFTELKKKNVELTQQLDTLQLQRKHLTEKERFEKVCHELSCALQREEKAQEILNEQSKQMEEMSMRLNIQTSKEIERNSTISEAVKSLSETKMELRRKDQSTRQLNKQLSQLEVEKRELTERLASTENVLLMSTKEKEAVASYLKIIEVNVADIKGHIILRTDHKMVDEILNKMLSQMHRQVLEVVNPSPEVKMLKNVIETFVEAQKTTLSWIAALESEIDSNKQHISTLKIELNSACRREYHDENMMFGGTPKHPERSFGRLQPLFEHEKSCMESFVPLNEDHDYSVGYSSSPGKSKAMSYYHDSLLASSPERKTGQAII